MIAALLHNGTNPGAVFADLDAISAANARPQADRPVSCCPLTMEFTLASPYPVEGLASWQPALPLEGAALRALLADPQFRTRVRTELAAPATFRLFNGEWDKVQVVEAAQERHRELEQKSIAELARRAGKDPLDFMLDLALDEDLATIFTAQLLNSDEAAVGRLLTHPHSLVSLSDAGAHLTFFNDAGFGLHLMGHWVRERGVMSPPKRCGASPRRAPPSSASSIVACCARATPPTCCLRPATVAAPKAPACTTCPAAWRGCTRCAGRYGVGQRRAGGRRPRPRRQGTAGGRTADALRALTSRQRR